ncbi:peptidase associated/transthyretin-like domain-containing protein [Yeosuana marina]|uniref:hypothetical protein n=1 Tax=Yeosuana marina TaxID=1565536 RepID=UPI00141EFF19|nr:hypothetical protein [Yeosuana marina]
MKKLNSLICLVCVFGAYQSFYAQEYASVLDNNTFVPEKNSAVYDYSENNLNKETISVSEVIEKPADYKRRSPIYDFSESNLNNVDTIPDYINKENKIKISGTIYKSDGVTPASNVLLYIYQPDENGVYEMKKENHKRYVYHRAWIKTNEDGQYTFYTFMPGRFLHSNELKNIHREIKEPGKAEYALDAFFFDNDPLVQGLSESCRSQLNKSVLKLEKKNDIYVATKDIVLE